MFQQIWSYFERVMNFGNILTFSRNPFLNPLKKQPMKTLGAPGSVHPVHHQPLQLGHVAHWPSAQLQGRGSAGRSSPAASLPAAWSAQAPACSAHRAAPVGARVGRVAHWNEHAGVHGCAVVLLTVGRLFSAERWHGEWLGSSAEHVRCLCV